MSPEEPNSEITPEVVTPEAPLPKVVGYCRACGKALNESTVRNSHGTIYCEEHIPMQSFQQQTVPPIPTAAPPESPYSSPYTAAAPPPPIVNHEASPGLAFVLGLIPGVGAIYNGQYAKGLVHVVIIGLTISILSNDAARGFEPLISLMLAGFWFYMAFEAYHTARRRQQGLVVDEFSSLFPMHGSTSFPIAPILLIVLGVIFLLNNLDLFHIEHVIRYWPVLLIALGVFMLYGRMTGSRGSSETSQTGEAR
jgi:hypothetical protein